MDGVMLFEDYLRSQIQLGSKSGVVIIPDLFAKGIADWIEENRNKVEVVRCKDCKWYKTMYCKMDRWTDLVTIYVAKKDDYCSYGERRKDGKQ